MLAKTLLNKLHPNNPHAWVKAVTKDKKTWWHVHDNEEIPTLEQASKIIIMTREGELDHMLPPIS